MSKFHRSMSVGFVGFVTAASIASPTLGAVDSLVVLAPRNVAIGGAQLGAFTYQASTDTIFTLSSGAGRDLRKVTNLGSSAVGTQLITASLYEGWMRGGDSTRAGNPAPNNLLLNPVDIQRSASVGGGTITAGTNAYIVDIGQVVRNVSAIHGNTNYLNDYTQRMYRWNLQAAGNNSTPPGTPVGDVLKSVVNQTQLNQYLTPASPTPSSDANSAANTVTFFGTGYAGDGQSLYAAAGGGNGGIWRFNLQNDTVTRIMTDASRPGTNLAVGPGSTVTKDTLYLTGSNGTNNLSGVSALEYDRSTGTFGAAQTLLSYADLKTFLDVSASASNYAPGSFGVDEGVVYFTVAAGGGATRRSAILGIDEDGNVFKAVSHAERMILSGDAAVEPKQLQFRTASFNGTPTRQMMIGDPTGSVSVAGVWLFKPGDFNRDGLVNSSDGAKLYTDAQAGALSITGGLTSNTDYFKYDLNAADAAETSGTQSVGVDFKDVKIIQKFLKFKDGDADFDNILELSDVATIQPGYGTNTGNRTWITGDFNGDNMANFTDLQLVADTWLLTLPTPTRDDFLEAGFTGAFLDNAMQAFNVPEPSSALLLLGGAGMFLTARRRKSNS